MEIKCPHCNQVFNLSEDEGAKIRAQVRTAEFNEEVEKRLHDAIAAAEANAKLEVSKAVQEEKMNTDRVQRELDILKNSYVRDLDALESKMKSQMSEALLSEKEKTQEYQSELMTLKADAKLAEREHELEIERQSMLIKTEYESKISDLQLQVQAKQQEVNFYKDLKARASTKMVGEMLEQHCMVEFEKLRPTAFKNAYFDKDNTVSKTGSKGDFIYRDYEDGVEFISIMFEMKNEMETTEKKHKNQDFFKELDKDRNEKGCEYAILVSMLESDNELYNQGIVDVSHLYPKMYVVRPQFFIPIITILRNAALHSLDAQKALQELQNQDLDVNMFEKQLDEFKSKFAYNSDQTSKRLNESIETIDKAISNLQKVRDSIIAAERQMRLAGDRADGLTIKKLCTNNATMKLAFEEAHKKE